MTRFLFTNLWSDDLGLPMRTIPIALELKKLNHEVYFCNPAASPSKIISEAGLKNIIPELHHFPTVFAPLTNDVWNIDHFSALTGNLDAMFVENAVDAIMKVVKGFNIDVMVDSWNQTACLAARLMSKPLITIIQADMHPANKGFIWWKEPPGDLPNPTPVFNKILSSNGHAAISSSVELFRGDLTLCVGSPETDPIPAGENVCHIGPIFYTKAGNSIPDWLSGRKSEKPLIWVYSGNPEYGEPIKWADSIIVLKASIAAMAEEEVDIVMTTGHHDLPKRLSPLPANFRYEAFIPGIDLANQCQLIIHHGGHGSCMTGAFTGTPAVIIPTFSERESNARRMEKLGVAEILIPQLDGSSEKFVPPDLLRKKVKQILSDPSYTENAKQLSLKMQAYGGAEQAAHLIENFLAK